MPFQNYFLFEKFGENEVFCYFCSIDIYFKNQDSMKRKQSRQSGRFYLFDYQGITRLYWFRGEVIKLLFSAISILFFSSCNNEVLPYSDDTSSSPSEVKIGKLIPNSTWAMPEVYYLNSATLWFKLIYKFLSNKKLPGILPCQIFHLS